MKMNRRTEALFKLRSYTEEIDKDVTMILQSLQWDRKHILKHPAMVSCKYDCNHKMFESVEEHERECLLRQNGYTREDQFLPDPLSTAANTLVKLSKADITHIVDNAVKSDPTFKKGVGSGNLLPQTLDRLQCTYSADERRAIHDAVVGAAPACHDLTDLALPSVGEDPQDKKTKSRTEILAELRDMKRRRVKYRVAAKSRNYSDVLRDVIKTQMVIYNEVLNEVESKPNINEVKTQTDQQTERSSDGRGKHIDKNICNDKGEVSKHARDKDNEKCTRERPDRDYKYRDDVYDDSLNRRRIHRDTSRDIRLDRHQKPRDTHGHRNRSRDRQTERSNETRSDGKRDRDYKSNKRFIEKYDYEQSRDDRERERLKDHDKSRHKDSGERERSRDRREHVRSRHKREHERDNCEQKESDTERARNLLTQIKREIESVDEDVPNKRYNYKASVDVNSVKRDGEIITFERNCHEKYGISNSDQSGGRTKDKNKTDRNRDYKRHKEERVSDYEERRDKQMHKKSNNRDRNRDKEMRRSRIEEKHRTYYEVYAELNSRRNKETERDSN